MISINDEQRQLVVDNYGLLYSFLQKYHLSLDDYYDIAAIGLCKASKTYNGDKSNFSTYAYRCMLMETIHEFRKNTQAKTIPIHQIVYYQAYLNNDDDSSISFVNCIQSKENVEDNILSKVMLDDYVNKLSDRDKDIFVLLIHGYKQKEIADIVGCSQTIISRAKSKFKEDLWS